MEKVLQRVQRAEKNARRKADKNLAHRLRGEAFQRGRIQQEIAQEKSERLRQARINRRIDWDAGPLAPRRDVGDAAKTYGAIPSRLFMPPSRDPLDRPQHPHIRVGDRVVVIKGRDRGTIGVVDSYDEEQVSVKIRNVNVIDVHVPDWVKAEQNISESVFPQHQAIPLAEVRLVYPLPDPETGVPRDVVIDRLVLKHKEGPHKLMRKAELEPYDIFRVIPGTNTVIPWPEEAEKLEEEHESDTLRFSVDEETFRPFLIRPPMPMSVIDELRNKYSKYRTRHDYDYKTRKELEAAKTEGRKSLLKTMRTPLQELADLRMQQKRAQEKELSLEQLAKIGEVIAQEQARTGQALQES